MVGLIQDATAEPLGFRDERLGVAAGLDHEASDDPVKDGARVEPVLHVGKEVNDGHSRVFPKELDRDVALGRLDHYPGVGWGRLRPILRGDVNTDPHVE